VGKRVVRGPARFHGRRVILEPTLESWGRPRRPLRRRRRPRLFAGRVIEQKTARPPSACCKRRERTGRHDGPLSRSSPKPYRTFATTVDGVRQDGCLAEHLEFHDACIDRQRNRQGVLPCCPSVPLGTVLVQGTEARGDPAAVLSARRTHGLVLMRARMSLPSQSDTLIDTGSIDLRDHRVRRVTGLCPRLKHRCWRFLRPWPGDRESRGVLADTLASSRCFVHSTESRAVCF
jgi:hypothetical protein